MWALLRDGSNWTARSRSVTAVSKILHARGGVAAYDVREHVVRVALDDDVRACLGFVEPLGQEKPLRGIELQRVVFRFEVGRSNVLANGVRRVVDLLVGLRQLEDDIEVAPFERERATVLDHRTGVVAFREQLVAERDVLARRLAPVPRRARCRW